MLLSNCYDVCPKSKPALAASGSSGTASTCLQSQLYSHALMPEWRVPWRKFFHFGSRTVLSTSLTAGGGFLASSAVTGGRRKTATAPRLPDAATRVARRCHETAIAHLSTNSGFLCDQEWTSYRSGMPPPPFFLGIRTHSVERQWDVSRDQPVGGEKTYKIRLWTWKNCLLKKWKSKTSWLKDWYSRTGIFRIAWKEKIWICLFRSNNRRVNFDIQIHLRGLQFKIAQPFWMHKSMPL